MTALFLQIIVGFLVLGILVFVHELGHFLMAKLCGIRVLAFSIGFGKPLYKKTVGETEYRISAVPFGGYVHMAGEHPEDTQENKPDEFQNKPIWQRALVAVSGPGANFLFSFALLWVIFMSGSQQPLYLDRPVVGAVADTSIAAEAGLLPGDSIVAVNNEDINSWEDLQNIFTKQEPIYRITYIRNNNYDTTTMDMENYTEEGLAMDPTGGLRPSLPAVIGNVAQGSPAEDAGLQKGDTIVRIDDDSIYSWFQLSDYIASYDTVNQPMEFQIERKDTIMTIAASPEYDTTEGRYLMGVAPAQPPTRTVKYGFFAAFSQAGAKTWEYTTMIFDVLGKLFNQQVSPKQLAGPIGIVQMSGVVALSGLIAILNFMALIGVNLAVLNLFPLIITDGGMLLFLLLEAVRGKPLSLKSQMLINRIAIAFFITLFLFVTFNDIRRIPEMFKMFNR